MATIDVGKKAPNFKLVDQHGEHHELKNYAGRSVVLYFYPKDDTSGCTAEACQFRDHHPDFVKVKAAIIGISPDSESSHAKFESKHALGFTLLADPPNAKNVPPTCAAYGVWEEKSMYGRKYMGVVRTTYLIGPDGRVAARWDNVKVPGHAAEVLAAARKLHSDTGKGVIPSLRKQPAKPKVSKAGRAKGNTASKTSRSGDSNPPYKPVRGPGRTTVSRAVRGRR